MSLKNTKSEPAQTAGNAPELFRSKSVEKLAMRWTGENAAQMWEFCESVTFEWIPEQGERQAQHNFCIATLEGVMRGNIGDWLIRGLAGEFYPCKPDVFVNSYERVAASSQEAATAPVRGSWPLGVHRAFVAGADWWQWHANKATMFASERHEAEAEAVRKFGPVGTEPAPSPATTNESADEQNKSKLDELCNELKRREDFVKWLRMELGRCSVDEGLLRAYALGQNSVEPSPATKGKK